MTGFRFCVHHGKDWRGRHAGRCSTMAVPNTHPPLCRWHGGEAARKQGFVGIFARNRHPKAFHSEGYVLLLVQCDWDQELRAVIDVVSRKRVPEPMGHTVHWYGGWFEYVACVTAPVQHDRLIVESEAWQPSEDRLPDITDTKAISLGDYRAVIVTKAAQLLREIGRS